MNKYLSLIYRYTNELRECAITLMMENLVPIRQIQSVIRTVLGRLAHTSVSHIPSVALLSRFMTEGKILASKQAADSMITGTDYYSEANPHILPLAYLIIST